MTSAAIRTEGLGKRYRLGARRVRYHTLRDQIGDLVATPFRRIRSVLRGESTILSAETLWALDDVSLEVAPGEVVGVVGRNGAGKTTLLKLLSRITEPTVGRAEIRGRVASLLEVGTGFHPELTGRENIYLNGAILGMKRAEIAAKFDEIVAFAEVERFIDTQVKHFSSGMYLRLAFAVAAHLDPEILLVDEVLAVGDAAFQRKCLGKMGEVAGGGRTVLFVSHNMEAVQRLCGRCIWLEQGRITRDGPTDEVITSYLKQWSENLGATYTAAEDAGGDPLAQLVEATVLDAEGQSAEHLRFSEPFTIRSRWRHGREVPGAYYFLRVHDSRDRFLFAVNSVDQAMDVPEEGCFEVLCHFPYNVLVPGDYSVHLGCHVGPRRSVFIEGALGLSVLDAPYRGIRYTVGGGPIIAPQARWERSSTPRSAP